MVKMFAADHYFTTTNKNNNKAAAATEEGEADMITILKRRRLQRHACLISVMAAFFFGLVLGIFLPLFGYYSESIVITEPRAEPLIAADAAGVGRQINRSHVMPHFPTIDDLRQNLVPVSFVPVATGSGGVEEIVPGSYRRLPNDLWIKKAGLRKPSSSPPLADGILKDDIFWGPMIEASMPTGFTKRDAKSWLYFLNQSEVIKVEAGCGRMQNRLVHFRDGSMACARYRQNTDQLQGELFSFYLGQLLNLTNLAPSAAVTLEPGNRFWSSAAEDVTDAAWKKGRPVVLTQWVPRLEAAGIPKQFQPIDKHLNKFDIKNLTMTLKPHNIQLKGVPKLVELAQWSDLIVFDYLIANLDRVVNNLYNHQWNADIMEAPAHNLAKQVDSNLLIFLDNESGLLHGYRLLKKYETYHGLLLDHLCVFREPTIAALRQLRASNSIGSRLNRLFELTTSQEVRDVLPPLPEKSVKTLVNRIDRVLDQVQKCRDTFSSSRSEASSLR